MNKKIKNNKFVEHFNPILNQFAKSLGYRYYLCLKFGYIGNGGWSWKYCKSLTEAKNHLIGVSKNDR
jgi:hypothetical protein